MPSFFAGRSPFNIFLNVPLFQPFILGPFFNFVFFAAFQPKNKQPKSGLENKETNINILGFVAKPFVDKPYEKLFT